MADINYLKARQRLAVRKAAIKDADKSAKGYKINNFANNRWENASDVAFKRRLIGKNWQAKERRLQKFNLSGWARSNGSMTKAWKDYNTPGNSHSPYKAGTTRFGGDPKYVTIDPRTKIQYSLAD